MRSVSLPLTLRTTCVPRRNFFLLALITVLTLPVFTAQAQYSTRLITSSNTFPADSTSGFSLNQPASTDGKWVAYSTNDAIWSQSLPSGTPTKLFSVGSTLPGSGATAGYIYGQTQIDNGTIVFFANAGTSNGTLYGLYSIKADGSGAVQRVADSSQVAGGFWYEVADVYGRDGLFQASGGVVVFAISGVIFSANEDGSNLTTLWQDVGSPGFNGCSSSGEYNSIFTVSQAYSPTTDGTNLAFGASSDLSFAGIYQGPLNVQDSCGNLINSGGCNICGSFSTLPGQPQPGTAFTLSGNDGIVLDNGYVYFGADAGNGVSNGQDYYGYFKIPLTGGPATAIVTNISHVPGLTDANGDYENVNFGGFAVRNGLFVFLAGDNSGTQAFYKVVTDGDTTSYVPLFYGGTSVSNVCAGNLEYGNLGGLQTPTLSPDGQLVFTAEMLSNGPEYDGTCNGFYRFQPIGYYLLDTNHPLLPSETTLSITPNVEVVPGQPLTLKIAVGAGEGASNPSSLVPTGVVTAYWTNPQVYGIQQPGSTTIDGSGNATLTIGSLNPGAYTFTVAYGGDANFSSSVSKQFLLQVYSQTSVSLTASSTNVPYGTPITFTATAGNREGYAMNGKISLLNGTKVLYTETLKSNKATFTTSASALPSGIDNITAEYLGDATSSTGVSNVVAVTVGPRPSTMSLTGTPTVVYGTANALTAKVTGATGGPAPTGTVTFTSGNKTYGVIKINALGVAELNSGALPAGNVLVNAAYSGDTNYSSTTATPYLTKVTPAATTTIVSGPAEATVGKSVSLVVTVKGVSSGAAPVGKVTVYDGTTALGSINLAAGTPAYNGTATFITAKLTAGSNSITAVYGGDSEYTASTSSAITVTATPNVAAAAPTFTPTPGTYSQVLTVTLYNATPGTTIHYALHGAIPTASSPVYTSPLTVNTTTTIKAIALGDDYLPSPVATATYTIQ